MQQKKQEIVDRLKNITILNLNSLTNIELQRIQAQIKLYKLEEYHNVYQTIDQIILRRKPTIKQRQEHTFKYITICLILLAIVSATIFCIYQMLRPPLKSNGEYADLTEISIGFTAVLVFVMICVAFVFACCVYPHRSIVEEKQV